MTQDVAADDAGVARAEALLEVGRADAARREILAVLAADPHHVEALHVLARTHQAEDDFPAMRDAAARAVSVGPGQYEGHLLLAFAHVGMEELAAARASAVEAVRLDPDDWRGHAALALASLGLGQPRRAFRAIRRAVGLAPESAGPHYIRASMYQSIRWNTLANRSYRRALALDPEHRAALTGLGQVAATRGRLATAAGHVSAVLTAEPTNDVARAELDRLVVGGLAGWAMMSVWAAGFLGVFAMLPWMWVLVLLPPALWLLWATRTWRALSPGARRYAEHVLRTDPRARVRVIGVALFALTTAGLAVTALRQDPDESWSGAMLALMVAHFLALMVSTVAIAVADRRAARRPDSH
ncbi:tetratricopeptide repeat protein [Micromonospora endolithica]|uniref:Uncharacterized protein n=1 Tax=Micromonospora endolithica TaxID=230091 RepID=A0A3A9YRI6_9ACTN|nr:tetratricopeptide repeat protein [Micromonospora endolithica]RKN37967.1 hypothetical protein D7223_31920 [Micromonospora endolithica]TWJ22445.1 tetratricopeptide repeat protein [Micromonospora endolithica]